MKKTLKRGIVIGLLSLSAGVMAQAATAQPEAGYQQLATNPFACMGRGIMNLGMCWIEIPRCMFYDNSQVPAFGLLYGSIEGAGFTTYRAIAGLYDFMSLGYSGEGLYNRKFPEFFWESKWLPPADKAVPKASPAPPVAPAPAVAPAPVAAPVAAPAPVVKPLAPAPAAAPAAPATAKTVTAVPAK